METWMEANNRRSKNLLQSELNWGKMLIKNFLRYANNKNVMLITIIKAFLSQKSIK